MTKNLPKPTVAILDLYNGAKNMGMSNIQQILTKNGFDFEVFDVRAKMEIPNGTHDLYISTGGPGSPYDGEGGEWENRYFNLIDKIWDHNQTNEKKKHIFFICHSFQMMVRHFDIGYVCKRKSMSFGVFPIHKTKEGENDAILKTLADPFFAADFRHYQVVQPKDEKIAELGGAILSLEKVRPHLDFERAIMAMRISPEFFGTQFHPEADPEGMKIYYRNPERRAEVIEQHGENKYDYILNQLDEKDADSILHTYNYLLPAFLTQSYNHLQAFYS